MQGYAIWYITSDRDLVITAHCAAETGEAAIAQYLQTHPYIRRDILVAIPTNTEVFKHPREVKS